MIRVEVTLDDSHKTSEGYAFMFGEDNIFTTTDKFIFEIETYEGFCRVFESKINTLNLKDFKITFKK